MGICPTLPNQWHLSIMAFAPRLMGTWQVLRMRSGHSVFRCVGLLRPSQMDCRRFRIFDIPMASLARICHLGTSLESYLDPGSCVLLKAYVLKLKSLLLNILMDRMVWSIYLLEPWHLLTQVYQPSYYQVIHAQAIMEFPFSKQEPTHTRSVLITGIPIFSWWTAHILHFRSYWRMLESAQTTKKSQKSCECDVDWSMGILFWWTESQHYGWCSR